MYVHAIYTNSFLFHLSENAFFVAIPKRIEVRTI